MVATDQDTFLDFKTINYKFADNVDDDIKDYFKIDAESGYFFLKKSVKGLDTQFAFEVIAFDNPTDTTNQKKETSTVQITITKNYPPTFPEKIYTQELTENDKISFGFTRANDRNNDEGGNDTICYYLLNQTELFQIPDRTKANIEVRGHP